MSCGGYAGRKGDDPCVSITVSPDILDHVLNYPQPVARIVVLLEQIVIA